jgi:hypothetical protein
MAQEEGEQIELAGAQGERPPAPPGLPGGQVELHVRVPEALGLGRLARAAPGAAQQRAHAQEELLEGEGLRQVVVGAAGEAGRLVGELVPGGQHDDRHGAAPGAEPARHLQAVQRLRQHHVQHHHVRLLLARQPEGRRAILGGPHGVSREAQAAPQHAQQVGVVLDDEDGGERRRLPWGGSGAGHGRLTCGPGRA